MSSSQVMKGDDRVGTGLKEVLAKLAAISKHCNSLLAQSITLQEAVDRLNDSTEASSTMSPEAKLLIAAAESTVRESSRIAQLLEDDCSAGANTLQHISHVHKQEKEQMHIDRVLSNPQLHMPSRRTKIFAQPLLPDVSFEQLRDLAKSKRHDQGRPARGSPVAVSLEPRKRGPARPSRRTLRTKKRRTRKNSTKGGVATSVAADAGAEIPQHPHRTREEQLRKLQEAVAQAVMEGTSADQPVEGDSVDADEVDSDIHQL